MRSIIILCTKIYNHAKFYHVLLTQSYFSLIQNPRPFEEGRKRDNSLIEIIIRLGTGTIQDGFNNVAVELKFAKVTVATHNTKCLRLQSSCF